LSAQIIYDRETASALDMGTKRAMRALLRRWYFKDKCLPVALKYYTMLRPPNSYEKF
jgi:hypothetical protein